MKLTSAKPSAFIVIFTALALMIPVEAFSGKAKVQKEKNILKGRIIFTADDHFELKSGRREYVIYLADETAIKGRGADSGPMNLDICQYIRVKYKTVDGKKTASEIIIVAPSDCVGQSE
jgi:hypothetical protein